MVRRVIGYFLAGLGFLGFGFFRNHDSSLIEHPTVWFTLSIIIGIIGLYFIYISKSKKISKQEKYDQERLVELKTKGERIQLTLDNCETRENSYYEEIVNENMTKSQIIDASFDSNRNYKQQHVVQSAIIYFYKAENSKIKMTSQVFPFSSEILSNYIENNLVTLYVNRFDKNNYAFELNS